VSEPYEPFGGIRRAEGLLLVKTKPGGSATISVDEPYYAEICAWVNLRLSEDALFSERGRPLLTGERHDGTAWRLTLTPHGYLHLETAGADPVRCESVLPVHACADCSRTIRVGLSIGNYGWMLRDTPYAREASAYARVRLLVGTGEEPLTAVGGLREGIPSSLAPVPETLRIAPECEGMDAFEGEVLEVCAYNTERVELLDAQLARRADDILPLVPGGGGFEPRWVGEDTVEVFTRPEFTQTSSYWVLLKLVDPPGHLRRLRLWTIWHGGANMTPTFFWSPDRAQWRRIAPTGVHMDEYGKDFRVEFAISDEMRAGGWLASGPVFGDEERAELLNWSVAQPLTSVSVIGSSVQGRPLHCIRVGAGPDGPGRPGVAITCGQHSPLETMGARVLQPFIRRITAEGGLAESCNFYLIPTVNVDCAHYGGNGLNANLRNTNRHWAQDVQPETAAVIAHFDALELAGQSIDFALDIHAGGIFRNHVLMPMAPGEGATPDAEAIARQERLLDLLEEHAGLRRRDGWPLPQMRLRATDYFHQTHGCPAFCLEISSCSYFDPETGRTWAFDLHAFDLLARGLAETLSSYLGGA